MMLVLTDILQWINEVDTDLLLAVNGAHNSYLDHFMYAFSGKAVWIPMYTALAYMVVRNFSWRVALLCFLAVAVLITLTDHGISHGIRPILARMRPANLDGPIGGLVHVVHNYRGGSYGLPSCHAANTAALAFFITFLFRRRWLTVFLMGWVLVTCYSRAYLGLHYPGDLVLGTLIGAIVAWLIYRLFLLVSKSTPLEQAKYQIVPIATGLFIIFGMLVYSGFLLNFT